MHGYMNNEALKKTIETKEVYYWSRSRNKIWHKGQVSGFVQKVKEIRIRPRIEDHDLMTKLNMGKKFLSDGCKLKITLIFRGRELSRIDLGKDVMDRVIEELSWMPSTCAYRLIQEGKELPWWHPQVSGNPNTVHEAGISVRGRVVSEKNIPDEQLANYIDEWPQ